MRYHQISFGRSSGMHLILLRDAKLKIPSFLIDVHCPQELHSAVRGFEMHYTYQ